jgi:hypothetical protein
VEPGGDRGPSLYRDGGAPALVEVADGEDAVLVTSLGEGVLGVWLFARPAAGRTLLAMLRTVAGGCRRFAVDRFVDRAIGATVGSSLIRPTRGFKHRPGKGRGPVRGPTSAKGCIVPPRPAVA